MIRLSVRCRPADAERVLAELIELAPGGVEEDRGDGYVEYAIYGPPGELPELPDLEARAGAGPVEIGSTEIPDDWADRWRDFHRPVEIGDRVVVRPSWLEPDGTAPIEIVIDPGRAFGTGAHATTRLCLELLIELSDRGAAGPLADWGTGSGVLAIAAAKLGFAPVVGCDQEPAAVDAAAANARANGVEVALTRVNLRETAAPSAPTVSANMTAPVLLEVAGRLAASGRETPRTLVASGLLASELDSVSAAFAAAGLAERERRACGEWNALVLSSEPQSPR